MMRVIQNMILYKPILDLSTIADRIMVNNGLENTRVRASPKGIACTDKNMHSTTSPTAIP